jgi:peptidyl-tRNA hydrolase
MATMNTKLTLRLDTKLLAKAKRFSNQSGKSVSHLVSDYFALIGAESEDVTTVSPTVRALIGTMKGAKVSEDDYRLHLERKAR